MGIFDDITKSDSVKDLALGVIGGVVSILGTRLIFPEKKEVDEDDSDWMWFLF